MSAELALAAVVFSLAAVLVNSQPARQAANAPFSTEVPAGPSVLVEVVVDHTRAGPNTLHLYALHRDGSPLVVPEIDARLNQGKRGIVNLPVQLELAGPGHFISSGLDLPIPGTWILSVTVRTTAIDEYYAPPVAVHIH